MNQKNLFKCSSFFIVVALIWSVIRRKTEAHFLGDTLLSRDFYVAGQNFLILKFKFYGLAEYQYNGTHPYTHLPPGPEWLQAIIGIPLYIFKLLTNKFVDEFVFHTLVTSILSISMIIKSIDWIIEINTKIFKFQGSAAMSKMMLTQLVLSSALVQVFSGNPHWFGNFLGIFIGLAVGRVIIDCQFTIKNWIFIALSLANAFWMGLLPAPVVFIFLFLMTYLNHNRVNLRGILIKFFIVSGISIIFIAFLKFYQNKLYFGSWNLVFEDAFGKIQQRIGNDLNNPYSGSDHFMKLFLRVAYLFGSISGLILYMSIKTEKNWFIKNKNYLILLLFAGLSWQLLMREHAYRHIFLLNILYFSLIFIFDALYRAQQNTFVQIRNDKLLKTVEILSITQCVALWGIVLIPGVR